MPRWIWQSMGIVLALAFFSGGSSQIPAIQSPRPNIVLIVLDDLDVRSVQVMTRTLRLLGTPGITFENMFVTTPVCCPSRASILTGRYAHNHGILVNWSPLGGFAKFVATGGEALTVAARLRAVGYRTALFGKYLNGYPDGRPSYVPFGWDEWYALINEYDYCRYQLNENGRVKQAGGCPADYQTDVLAAKATGFIKKAAQGSQPFFMYVTPVAPHWPATPAERHLQEFLDAPLAQPPSFDEADTSDKPAWLRRFAQFGSSGLAQLEAFQRKRLQSLLAVDEAIERLVRALEEGGKLEQTVILFTSDNGLHLGEHRIGNQKLTPYEESIRVPLIVRGPGVTPGVRGHMVLNIDLAPTIAELAGARARAGDGRSLVPLLASNPPPQEGWRQDFLVENWEGGQIQVPPYQALRTRDYLFVEYQTGGRELYDLRADPFQLESLHGRADPSLIRRLSDRLNALKQCAGARCRE